MPSTLYRPSSFAEAGRFIAAVAELADAADHHPDIDLRYGAVTIRLFSHDVQQLTGRDSALARAISHLAREFEFDADPAALDEAGSAEAGSPEPGSSEG